MDKAKAYRKEIKDIETTEDIIPTSKEESFFQRIISIIKYYIN